MPQLTLGQRVAALERQVVQLANAQGKGPAKDDWRQTIGIFTDDPGMLDLFADAMKIREADRKKFASRAGW